MEHFLSRGRKNAPAGNWRLPRGACLCERLLTGRVDTMKLRRIAFMCAALTVSLCVTSSTQTFAQQPGGCDGPCLAKSMKDFIAAMTAGKADSVPVAEYAEIRENAKVVPLAATTWTKVKALRAVVTFADPVTGNVVSRAGVELADGQPGYISTRLKVANGNRISNVEISADISARVAADYVWKPDPRFDQVLPPEQRMTRIDLEALGRRYFHSLSSHVAIATDFDDGCDRFHSGQRITNVAGNPVEAGPPRTCAGSLEGNPPWGPATEQRFPVIDPERGIVFGVTLLHYPTRPDQTAMYVSEIFKVVRGKIVRIDNIGLMMQGVASLGFTH